MNTGVDGVGSVMNGIGSQLRGETSEVSDR